MKKYMNLSLVYAIIALAGGVYYRELTKALAFTGNTQLSVVHTHFFILGMLFFLVLLMLEKIFAFSNKKTNSLILTYNVGLNIAGLCFLVRGTLQALMVPLSKAADASISGIAGIGHIILGVSIVMLLLEIRKKAN